MLVPTEAENQKHSEWTNIQSVFRYEKVFSIIPSSFLA